MQSKASKGNEKHIFALKVIQGDLRPWIFPSIAVEANFTSGEVGKRYCFEPIWVSSLQLKEEWRSE